MSKYLTSSRTSTPLERAEELEKDDSLEAQHQSAAVEGSSDADNEVNDAIHYVAFVEYKGMLLRI